MQNITEKAWYITNKANLKDLIAATGLVILLKLDSNRRFFSPCDLEIWWMTQKNNRAPLQCYFKLFTSFRSHWWIQTGVTAWKRLIWVKINNFFSRDLAVWRITLKNNRAPLLCYFKLCASFRSHWWITLTPYMVLPRFATRFTDYAGGIRVSFNLI